MDAGLLSAGCNYAAQDQPASQWLPHQHSSCLVCIPLACIRDRLGALVAAIALLVGALAWQELHVLPALCTMSLHACSGSRPLTVSQ